MTAPATLRRTDLLDSFSLPAWLEATAPPEHRGLRRDQVRLLVSDRSGIRHRRFVDLRTELRRDDLLVANTSRTLPASVVVDESLAVHFSTPLPGGLQVVEMRSPEGPSSRPITDVTPGRVDLPGGAHLEILTPYPITSKSRRLWAAAAWTPGTLHQYLATWGRPIRYPYVDAAYPLDAYQTVFGSVPGSAEMPSAGRPFSRRLVTDLVTAGINIATLVLHTGVSSLESGETPYPEWFELSPSTAALVNHTHDRGGRVIAVGTTVIRALETTAGTRGTAHPGRGWTDLVITPDHNTRVVDGIITGWHDPTSTHLDMLVSLGGRGRLEESYQAALSQGYLWHEFGDSHLMINPVK